MLHCQIIIFPKKSPCRVRTTDGALFTLELRYILQIVGYFRTADKITSSRAQDSFACFFIFTE